MKMRQVPCISGPCAKHLSVFGYGRYWDHLSLYGHMERIEIQNITAGTRCGILRKTIEVYLLQTCFVVDNFGSNRTGIAIWNAWRLLVLKIWRDFTLDRFLIQHVAYIQSVNAFIDKFDFQKRAVLCFWRFTYPDSFEKSVGGNIKNDTLKSMLRRCNFSKI